MLGNLVPSSCVGRVSLIEVQNFVQSPTVHCSRMGCNIFCEIFIQISCFQLPVTYLMIKTLTPTMYTFHHTTNNIGQVSQVMIKYQTEQARVSNSLFSEGVGIGSGRGGMLRETSRQ